jgi:hypothetical protein
MSNYYRFFIKDRSFVPPGVSTDDFYGSDVGELLQQQYPLTASIGIELYPNPANPSNEWPCQDIDRRRIDSLVTALKRNERYSQYYSHDFKTGDVCMISIPAVFFGSSLERGSVTLNTYCDGVLTAQLRDHKLNGELWETQQGNRVCGIVLYEQGIILLFDTDAIQSYTEEFYTTENNLIGAFDNPRWINWGLSGKAVKDKVVRTSYDIDFRGVHTIPQLTLFAHAPRGELNHSNNPTYIRYEDNNKQSSLSDKTYIEDATIQIKNVVKTDYVSPEPLLRKETYISKILIYDEDRNVIGVAKVATPVRKEINRDYTFKLKLNL